MCFLLPSSVFSSALSSTSCSLASFSSSFDFPLPSFFDFYSHHFSNFFISRIPLILNSIPPIPIFQIFLILFLLDFSVPYLPVFPWPLPTPYFPLSFPSHFFVPFTSSSSSAFHFAYLHLPSHCNPLLVQQFLSFLPLFQLSCLIPFSMYFSFISFVLHTLLIHLSIYYYLVLSRFKIPISHPFPLLLNFLIY